MFCSKCGKENFDTAKFCFSCGSSIGTLKQETGGAVKTKNNWKYNSWKDPNIEKPDRVLAVVYIVGTIIFPVSVVIWLFVLWLVRGRKLPLIFKQSLSAGIVLGAIGGCMAWHDAFNAPTTAVQQGQFQH